MEFRSRDLYLPDTWPGINFLQSKALWAAHFHYQWFHCKSWPGVICRVIGIPIVRTASRSWISASSGPGFEMATNSKWPEKNRVCHGGVVVGRWVGWWCGRVFYWLANHSWNIKMVQSWWAQLSCSERCSFQSFRIACTWKYPCAWRVDSDSKASAHSRSGPLSHWSIGTPNPILGLPWALWGYDDGWVLSIATCLGHFESWVTVGATMRILRGYGPRRWLWFPSWPPCWPCQPWGECRRGDRTPCRGTSFYLWGCLAFSDVADRGAAIDVGCGLGDILLRIQYAKKTGLDSDQKVLNAAALISKLFNFGGHVQFQNLIF